MARIHQNYISTHPGKELAGNAFKAMKLASAEGQFAHHGANHLSLAEGGICLMRFGDIPYSGTNAYTETKTNSSTITTVGGGVRFQTQASPSDGDAVGITSLRTFVPQAGVDGITPQIYIASARLQVSSAANMGLAFGFVTSSTTDAVSSDPSSGFFFRKAKNSANLIGSTVLSGGTRHDSGTLLAMGNATDAVLTVVFSMGASAATSWGRFWVNGTATAMTSAQVADVFGMVAATPTLAAHFVFVGNSTTQRNGLVSWALAELDR